MNTKFWSENLKKRVQIEGLIVVHSDTQIGWGRVDWINLLIGTTFAGTRGICSPGHFKSHPKITH